MSAPARSVSEALLTRRSVRAFKAQDIDESVLRRVVELAGRAPSGGNLQPWHLVVLKGEPLAEIRRVMARRVRECPEGEGLDGEGVDYRIYPDPLAPPYLSRRVDFGSALYQGLGIDRGDVAGRRRWHERNFQFFDAPAAIFCYVERGHGRPQWSDLGMILMSLMLLLREAGLDSCPQECWARYARTVDGLLAPPANLMLFCGLSIGYADTAHPVNDFPSTRAAVADWATFRGFADITPA